MEYRYVVTRPWGDHKRGDVLETVDAEHASFVARVAAPQAAAPAAEPAQPKS